MNKNNNIEYLVFTQLSKLDKKIEETNTQLVPLISKLFDMFNRINKKIDNVSNNINELRDDIESSIKADILGRTNLLRSDLENHIEDILERK